LRDLDDALSMLFLFANLPSTSTVPPKTIALCQRLCLEFEHYLIASHSLRKSFLSIKGIYYEATIQGQDIRWLVPYKFVQRVTGDVDFRIMGTFVEFYTTLLGFVNFRLYTSIGLIYPPKFNAKSDEEGGELDAITLEGKGIQAMEQIEVPTHGTVESQANGDHNLSSDIQKQIQGLSTSQQDDNPAETQDADPTDEPNDAIDTFEPTDPSADILPQPPSSTTSTSTLFAPFTFYLSRETPRAPLEFLLRAFGCKRVGWDAILGHGAFTTNEADPGITHQIVDRPPLANLPEGKVSITEGNENTVRPGMRMPGRTYLQPQWVWDCINQVKLLRPDLYAPGATLPPHLSPWVKPGRGGYDPTVPLAEQEREGEAEDDEVLNEEDEDEEGEVGVEVTSGAALPTDDADNAKEVDDDNGMAIAPSDTSSSSSSSPAPPSFSGFSPTPSSPQEEEEEEENSSNEPPSPHLLHQLELETEARGSPLPSKPAALKGILKAPKQSEASRQRAREKREGEEEVERRKGMMGRRKRKVLEKMLWSNARKEEEAEGLRRKRRRIEGVGA